MWKNKIEEGNGKYIYKNGDIYGYFKEGKREGKGLYKYKVYKDNKIIKYFGEWKNNKKNREGIIYYENGDEIEGKMILVIINK